MANLLPLSQKINIKKTYHMRLLIVALVSTLLLILVGTTMLIPALIAGVTKEKITREYFATISNVSTREQYENIQKEIADLNQKTTFILENENRGVTVSEIIKNIISHRNKDISLRAFSYEVVIGSTSRRLITISGIAERRQALVLFIENLKADSFYSDVLVPVSNFVKNTDVSFTITVVINDHGIFE